MLTTYRQDHPTHRIIHLFFTDGNANTGLVCPTSLAALLPNLEGTYHFYIGIGEAHNSMILQQCAQNPRSEYWFILIDDIQLVADEILHKIVHATVRTLRISVSSVAELYNWQTDMWSSTLSDTHLLESDVVKRIHVRWTKEDFFPTILSLTVETEGVAIPTTSTLRIELNPEVQPSILPYIFQQELMSLLHQCRNYCARVFLEEEDEEKQSVEKIIRQQLSSLYNQLKSIYGPLITIMKQDCKSALETLGMYSGISFSHSRLTFFGIQQVYTPRKTFKKRKKIGKYDELLPPPILTA